MKIKSWKAFAKALFLFLLFGLILLSLVAFLYWQRLKVTPQYSLALLIKAARDDKIEQINFFIDVDEVVDDFVSQVMDEAEELYGRNLPKDIIRDFSKAIEPALPVVRERVKQEIPRLIREQTRQFEEVPWWVIVLLADRFVDIRLEGEVAYVSKEGQSLALKMRRKGEFWKVVSVRDKKLARRVAESIGQEFILFVSKEGLRKASERFGMEGLDKIIRKIENSF